MRLERFSEEELKKEILEIVGNSLDLQEYKLFFFGSRAGEGEKGDEHSDIDIGIEGKTIIPAKAMREIKEKIDNLPILYKIEIVDLKDVSEDFYEIAKQNIEEIN